MVMMKLYAAPYSQRTKTNFYRVCRFVLLRFINYFVLLEVAGSVYAGYVCTLMFLNMTHL